MQRRPQKLSIAFFSEAEHKLLDSISVKVIDEALVSESMLENAQQTNCSCK
jgi:hypothetical protein